MLAAVQRGRTAYREFVSGWAVKDGWGGAEGECGGAIRWEEGEGGE